MSSLPSVSERAWAAGLFEGEGCFGLYRANTGRHAYQYPRAEMTTTDEDVLRKFHEIVGVGGITGPHIDPRKPTYKPKWHWTAVGHQPTQYLVILLWTWLCERRRSRAAEVLTARPIGRLDSPKVERIPTWVRVPRGSSYGPWHLWIGTQTRCGRSLVKSAGNVAMARVFRMALDRVCPLCEKQMAA